MAEGATLLAGNHDNPSRYRDLAIGRWLAERRTSRASGAICLIDDVSKLMPCPSAASVSSISYQADDNCLIDIKGSESEYVYPGCPAESFSLVVVRVEEIVLV
jgi:hypothetical protein